MACGSLFVKRLGVSFFTIPALWCIWIWLLANRNMFINCQCWYCLSNEGIDCPLLQSSMLQLRWMQPRPNLEMYRILPPSTTFSWGLWWAFHFGIFHVMETMCNQFIVAALFLSLSLSLSLAYGGMCLLVLCRSFSTSYYRYIARRIVC